MNIEAFIVTYLFFLIGLLAIVLRIYRFLLLKGAHNPTLTAKAPGTLKPKTLNLLRPASAMFQIHLWTAPRESLPKKKRLVGVLCLGGPLMALIGV